MDFPAGYGNAIVSYIALLVLCYMGQNIDSAVFDFLLLLLLHFRLMQTTENSFIFPKKIFPEWNDKWCIDQYELVLFAIVQAKRYCPYVKSHAKWCSFNASKTVRQIDILFFNGTHWNFAILTRYIPLFPGSFECAQLW